MQFDREAFLQLATSKTAVVSAAAVAAAFGVAGIVYMWPGSNNVTAEQVVVNGPVFKPITLTPPTPTPAMRPSGLGEQPAPRYDDNASLTRAVQVQLKRASCYDGPVNGVWNPPTRRGMAQFTSLVNARLPVDRPDAVLLGLLETNQTTTCAPGSAPPGAKPEPKDVRKAAPKEEVASIGDEPRVTPREETEPKTTDARDSTPSVEKYSAPGLDPARTKQASAETGPAEMETASTGSTGEVAALGAAGAAGQKVMTKDRRHTSRRYRKSPSLARSVSKGLKSIQRSLNKLF